MLHKQYLLSEKELNVFRSMEDERTICKIHHIRNFLTSWLCINITLAAKMIMMKLSYIRWIFFSDVIFSTKKHWNIIRNSITQHWNIITNSITRHPLPCWCIMGVTTKLDILSPSYSCLFRAWLPEPFCPKPRLSIWFCISKHRLWILFSFWSELQPFSFLPNKWKWIWSR